MAIMSILHLVGKTDHHTTYLVGALIVMALFHAIEVLKDSQ